MFGDSEFTIIPNAIDFNKYYYNENDRVVVRKKYNIGLNNIVFCHTGRMVEQKNPIFLISLFKKLYEHNNEYYLIYVGDGVLKDKIYNLVDEIDKNLVGFKKHIVFIGAALKEEIPKYLSASDMFLLPSNFEGLPICIIEALVNCVKCFVASHISREADILNNIDYIDLDLDLWLDKIKKYICLMTEKKKLTIDSEYDINNEKYINAIDSIFKGF